MALGKTGASAITYTPFNKTSFGYGSGEIAAAHSSLTNVKVVLTVKSGVNQWDDTGHISTPTSGSAVASYNKDKLEWSCEGSVADVDGVLDSLDLFPADYPAIRTWTTTATKPNQTTGNYTFENPADTVAIPDTDFDLKVYDPDNSYSLEATYTVTFEPTQPTFGKQRPYWYVVPAHEDCNTLAHDSDAGGLLDLGTVLQGSDTDPLTVTCEFRNYGTSTVYPGTAYGVFTAETGLFIGDKKPANRDTEHNRLNFTGTKAEVQSYLDTVRYNRNGNKSAFDMFFTISNGVVGSTLTKSIWYSDNVIGLTTVPEQEYDEDTAGPWDFGALVTSGVTDDVDNFKATITVPTAAASNITSSTAGITQSYTAGTGVYEVSHSSEATLLTALRNITFTPETDYDVDFDMTVQLTYTGSGFSPQSSYTSVAQTVTVSIDDKAEEMGNTSTSHTYVEDNAYSFSTNPALPQIIHNTNSNFTITFTLGITTGRLEKSGTAATLTSVGNGVFTLAGTRNNVNADLFTLKYIPAPDFNADHTISFSAIRTSGTGTPPTTTGSFTMTGTPVGEYTSTQLVDVVWEEDVNTLFDSGLQIIDTADEVEEAATFGSHYTVSCEMHYPDSGEFTDGILKVDEAGRSITTTTAGAFVVDNQYTILTINDGEDPAGADTDFTLIGAADNDIGTIFTATGVGAGTGTATGDSLTITGSGQGYDELAISGPKLAVNTAIKNIKFIPDPNYDGVGPWVWYYITRNYDSVYLTTLNAQGDSYPTDIITKFLPATSTDDYSPTAVELDWEENVTKVFDSGLEINDKVTENPEYNTSPTAFYGTTYTVDVAMYVAGGSTEYTNATLDTATKDNLAISGTGRGDTDKFQMTGSRAEINAALKTMKFIPNVDNVETINTTTLWYRIKRDYDYDWTTDTQEGAEGPLNAEDGLLLNQWLDVYTRFNTNTATTNYTSTPLTDIDWNEDEVKDFDSGIVITDKATENIDYGAYYDTTFTVTARAKWWDGSASQPMNNAIWTTTWPGNDDSYSVTGVGTVADPLTITGTKADVNKALANLRMAGGVDWIDSDASDGSFWFEYKLTRDLDLSGSPYIDYGTGNPKSEFNGGTAVAAYHSTVSPDDMAYNEDTVTKIFEGKTLGITETASDYHPDIKYKVELEISPNEDGTWGETGNSTYTTPKTTRQLINDDIQALDFRPTIDSAEDDTKILYTQRRYQNVTAGSFVVDTDYTVASLGNTTNTQWNTLAGTSGVGYSPGSTFTAATVGVGTGTADIVTVQASSVDIGTVTGTETPPYATSVSPTMTFVENIVTSIFSGKAVGIAETLDSTHSATYTVELECTPSANAKFTSNDSDKIIITGTKAVVNAAIQNLEVTPLADTNINFDILYSQTRHIPGSTDVVQALDVNIGTAVGTDVEDIVYATANQNIQYFVPHEHINGVDMTPYNYNPTAADHMLPHPTATESHEFIPADAILTPRQLSLNQGLPYSRPFTITDTTAGAQYKVVFSGGTMSTILNYTLNVMDTNWGTIDDIHEVIENGLYPISPTTSWFPHGSTFTFNFTLYKKTTNGVESTINIGQLTYSFLTGIDAYHIKPDSWRLNQLPYGTWSDTDKIETTESIDLNVYDHRHTGKWSDRLILFPTKVTSSIFSDDVLENAKPEDFTYNKQRPWSSSPTAFYSGTGWNGTKYIADPNSVSYGRSFASMGHDWTYETNVSPRIYVGLVGDINNFTVPGTSVLYADTTNVFGNGISTWKKQADGWETRREVEFAVSGNQPYGSINHWTNIKRQPLANDTTDTSWSQTIPYGPKNSTFPPIYSDTGYDFKQINGYGLQPRSHLFNQVNIIPILDRGANSYSYQTGITQKLVVTAYMRYGVCLKIGHDLVNAPLSFSSS